MPHTRVDQWIRARSLRFMRARNTLQLAAIENVLRSAGRPLAIEELHAAAAKELPRLGLATIYRAIGTLTTQGRIVSVKYAGQPTRYEWAVLHNHSHFICNRCKRVFNVDEPVSAPSPGRRPKGFVFQGHEVIYYGLCADCHPRDAH